MKGTIISRPLKVKVEVPIPIFETGLRLPTTNFFYGILRQYGFSVDDLTPNTINNIMGFELACRDLGVLPQFWAFKSYFNSSTQYGVHTSSQRRDIHAFIFNQKAPTEN